MRLTHQDKNLTYKILQNISSQKRDQSSLKAYQTHAGVYTDLRHGKVVIKMQQGAHYNVFCMYLISQCSALSQLFLCTTMCFFSRATVQLSM